MPAYKIAVIPGDGVGPEVLREGIRVLRAVEARFELSFELTDFPWGSDYYLQHGQMMASDALERLQPFDAIYFGAVGHPEIQDHVTLNGLLLPMRRGFDQYVCLRPSVLYAGVTSPLRDKKPGDIDMVVIRENSESAFGQWPFMWWAMPR